jgi:hypothetical protein
MYNGDEKLINNGEYLPYTMLNFWQWCMSNIRFSLTRGTFAEFIVRCALDKGGIHTHPEMGTGIEEYDLDGPVIPSTGHPARIEVKSASFLNSETGHISNRVSFSIAPAKVLEDNDYKQNSPQQRNNDIYVFTLYTATDNSQNILDLYWWQFYVLPTYKIESDEKLRKQKTISLKSIKKLCNPISFDLLCDSIIEACSSIPSEYEKYIVSSKY